MTEGVDNCTRRSLDEASTLRENPLTYKLACITNVCTLGHAFEPFCSQAHAPSVSKSHPVRCLADGDVTVAITPKVGAAQWTR